MTTKRTTLFPHDKPDAMSNNFLERSNNRPGANPAVLEKGRMWSDTPWFIVSSPNLGLHWLSSFFNTRQGISRDLLRD